MILKLWFLLLLLTFTCLFWDIEGKRKCKNSTNYAPRIDYPGLKTPGFPVHCPRNPGGVECPESPCDRIPNPCEHHEKCCENYKVGCDYYCMKLANPGCPIFERNVQCRYNPCRNPKMCKPGTICCDDLSKGCDFHCFPKRNETSVTRPGCPLYPTNVNCLVSPCDISNPCGENHICCEDFSEGCNYRCVNVKPGCPPLVKNVHCMYSPCRKAAACKLWPGTICCEDYGKACDYRCIRPQNQTL